VNAEQRPQPAASADLPESVERELPPGRHALHRERLMRRIDLDTPSTSPAPPRLRRRLALTFAAAVTVGAAAAVAVTQSHPAAGGPLSDAEVADWTGTPTQLDPATGKGADAQKWCLDTMKGAPGAGQATTITNADLRGGVASMIVNRGGNAMLCLVGSDHKGMWEVIDPVKSVAPDAITLNTAGAHGNGAAAFSYAEGSVGADVKAITMADGRHTFRVTVSNGRWTAWWPGMSQGGVPGSVTLTLANGTTRTVSGASMLSR
jgi:hypothetical protein